MTRAEHPGPVGGGTALATAPPEPGACRVARLDAPSGFEIRLAVAPEAGLDRFADQAASLYLRLRTALAEQGCRPEEIVAEKAFLADVGAEAGALRAARGAILAGGGVDGAALTCVGQPPASGGRRCELQVLVVQPAGSSPAPATPPASAAGPAGLPRGVAGRTVVTGGRRFLYLSGITGGTSGDGTSFARQGRGMFRRAERCLAGQGLGFGDVVRTWLYLADIVRDYAAINRARRVFYGARRLDPPPASTGIGGVPSPPDRACGLDLIAVDGARGGFMRPLHAPTMNEAPAYGADFSRGMRVDLEDRAILYVSGTASIDAAGRVAHAGDIEAQAGRMLLNVREILAGQGASFAHLTSAVTYLKDPALLGPFRRAAARAGLPEQVPHTVCLATICRPDWLCEMEATAVLA